jgi:hypothetical protein
MNTVGIDLLDTGKNIGNPITSIKIKSTINSVTLEDSNKNKVTISSYTPEIVIQNRVNLLKIKSIVYENINNTVVNNHSLLVNLNADDHPQYLNNTRGDSRYYKKQEVLGFLTAAQIEYVPGISVYDKIAALGEDPGTLNYRISGGYF